jgi:hypothetical protein
VHESAHVGWACVAEFLVTHRFSTILITERSKKRSSNSSRGGSAEPKVPVSPKLTAGKIQGYLSAIKSEAMVLDPPLK